jgi:hypothetical protein
MFHELDPFSVVLENRYGLEYPEQGPATGHCVAYKRVIDAPFHERGSRLLIHMNLLHNL